MGLDGKTSANEVYFQKSDFDFISDVARSQPKRRRIRMCMPRPVITKERENHSGGGSVASRSFISKRKKRRSRKFRYIPECPHFKNTQFEALNRSVGRERVEIVLKPVRTGIPAESAENWTSPLRSQLGKLTMRPTPIQDFAILNRLVLSCPLPLFMRGADMMGGKAPMPPVWISWAVVRLSPRMLFWSVATSRFSWRITFVVFELRNMLFSFQNMSAFDPPCFRKSTGAYRPKLCSLR